MKTRYINDVPGSIKALTYFGSVNDARIKDLESRIAVMTQEIYRLYDRQNSGILSKDESLRLEKYLKDLPDLQTKLKILKSTESGSNINYLFLIVPALILFVLYKRKK